MSQDGNQRQATPTQQQWLYNKYDKLDRLISQRIVLNFNDVDLATIRNHFNTPNASLPASFRTYAVLTETKYDNYVIDHIYRLCTRQTLLDTTITTVVFINTAQASDYIGVNRKNKKNGSEKLFFRSR